MRRALTETAAADRGFDTTGAVTAIMTNPIWVVKVRMFTTQPDAPLDYRNLWRASPPRRPRYAR